MPRPPQKLTNSKVIQVFSLKLKGLSELEIALKFGLSESYVHAVLTGKRRASVAPDHPDRIACVQGASEKAITSKAKLMDPQRPARLKAAISDYKRGQHSITDVAKFHRIPRTLLWKELKKQKFPFRLATERSPEFLRKQRERQRQRYTSAGPGPARPANLTPRPRLSADEMAERKAARSRRISRMLGLKDNDEDDDETAM